MSYYRLGYDRYVEELIKTPTNKLWGTCIVGCITNFLGSLLLVNHFVFNTIIIIIIFFIRPTFSASFGAFVLNFIARQMI
jgi:hypothetical protein